MKYLSQNYLCDLILNILFHVAHYIVTFCNKIKYSRRFWKRRI